MNIGDDDDDDDTGDDNDNDDNAANDLHHAAPPSRQGRDQDKEKPTKEILKIKLQVNLRYEDPYHSVNSLPQDKPQMH